MKEFLQFFAKIREFIIFSMNYSATYAQLLIQMAVNPHLEKKIKNQNKFFLLIMIKNVCTDPLK